MCIHIIVKNLNMAEMTEQQTHLASLLKQREDIVGEINDLNSQIASKRELLLRTLGALEYLPQIGVKLPETEESLPEPEVPEIEGEVVNAEGDLPEPETEG